MVSNRTVGCLTNVEAFSLRAADLEEVTSLFARFFRSPRVQGAIRLFSPPILCLACVFLFLRNLFLHHYIWVCIKCLSFYKGRKNYKKKLKNLREKKIICESQVKFRSGFIYTRGKSYNFLENVRKLIDFKLKYLISLFSYIYF